MRDFHPTDRLNGWLVTLGITALAFVIRVWNVGYPNRLVFDETYYPKDAWAILTYGYEVNWPDSANDSIINGNANVMSTSAEFAVHPPLGKMLIAVGEYLFGMNSFGWRIMSVVFGTILVFATIRLARRLSRSTLIGGIAGLLLTLDGLAFVMSRTGLLDIFQAAFLVIGVSCAVADRDWFRVKLATHLERAGLRDLGGQFGPLVWWRPWRLAAGLAFGAACAVKWNSLYALAAFGILTVLWDVGARRLAGARMKSWWALLADGVPGFVYLVVVGFLTYLATWIPWLVTSGGWDRDWGRQNPDNPLVRVLGEGFASLIRLHQDIYAFHTGDYINNATHPYSAHPALWLIMARPTGVDAVNNIAAGTDGCEGPDTCVRVISAAGTPVLWWMAAAALVVCIIWWLAARDWRFGVPVVAALSTYLPWFMYTSRPLFFFYAVTIIPFTCIGLAMVMGLILGDREPKQRRRTGAIIVGVAIALVALNFAYIYPILTDQLLPYSSWLARMWFGSWV
ncbi:dolichyl-phosphate-mannose--protein mannosyltransferase [Propionicicella superfundia]|uniref:dolichyl-phosphate-mannose--protein mannosyltransferase n=1 Tax=Propionicicella superfundia TaxID=348582 RepID=UPI0006859AA9|nr:phospholipid carrier-dependent glycosyltransferase [Propionicicella superfundia]